MAPEITTRPARPGLKRRSFMEILLGGTLLGLSPLNIASTHVDAMGLNELDSESGLVLAHVARLLFPHPELSEEIYLGVVRDIDADLARDAKLQPLVLAVPGRLDELAGAEFRALAPELQIKALTAMEGTPAFNYLRNRTIESLYRNPVVLKLVGYEGSSIEHGGYLHRGFDDIDWLEDV